MGMTIDEHIAQLKKLKSFHNGSYGASINFALDIMRKYQKIEELINKEVPECIHPTDRDKYKLGTIRAVLEDVNNQPTVEAIPKADVVAMLTELQLEIEEIVKEEELIDKKWADGLHYSEKIIQQKIDLLRSKD